MSTDTWKEFEHNPVSHSVAHHVVAIANLREKQGYARVSDVAKVLNITRGSASLTLKSLKQKGLVLEDENRFLLLSDGGQFIADSVRGKRLVMRKFFSEVLGVPADQAEVDTCKVEHLISEDAAHRLAMFLRFLGSDDPKVKAFREAWKDLHSARSDDSSASPACDPDALDAMHEERE
jgi:DtxR family Mn-dependent transcriptional regulator